jgi:hypothetical protein
MNSTVRTFPTGDADEPRHSFIQLPNATIPLFAGWGPKL